MKYSKYCLCLVCLIFCLTGCGKLTPEQQLCKNIASSIDQFRNSQIDYSSFLNNIKGDYDTYCVESSNVCVFLKTMYSSEELNKTPQDCSNLTGTFKDLCETSNQAKQKLTSQQSDYEKAVVDNIMRTCNKALGK